MHPPQPQVLPAGLLIIIKILNRKRCNDSINKQKGDHMIKTFDHLLTGAMILLILILYTGNTRGQDLDNKGKDFIMTFLPNLASPTTELHLTASAPTTVTVEYPVNAPTFSTSVAVNPGTITIVNIPAQASSGWTPGSVQDQAVHAYADTEFVCYMINRASATSDAALALPVDVMNTEYIVLTYNSNVVVQDRSEFAVVAGYNNTKVTITPNKALAGGYAAGASFSIMLNRGEAFLGQGIINGAAGDLTGTIISSDKPIGMTNGNVCTNVPPDVTFCDHIFEVAQPVQTWGNNIMVANLPNRPGGTIYRILASEDNTDIKMDGASLGMRNKGGYIETTLINGSHVFSSDKPIYVTQYMSGDSNPGADQGDPAMGNMIPSEQYLNAYTFSTVGENQFARNFVTIIAANSDRGTLQLDGTTIPAGDYSPIAGTSFSSVTKEITSGTHNTASLNGHGITVVGINNYDSYLYAGGARFKFINPVGDANAPICNVKFEGTSFYGTAMDARASEDVNNNDVLDPGEDLNGNGQIDEDTGIFFVVLAPGSVNLNLQVDPFVPGEPSIGYTVSLIDPMLPGNGSVVVTDGAGNTCSSDIDFGGGTDSAKSFIAVMLGKEEVPAVMTEGSGGGMFVLNASQDTLHYWIRVCELECPFTAAHFHNGAPGTAGPVVRDITASFTAEPDSSGYFAHGVWTSSDAQPLTPALVAELLNGNIYVNVHSTGHPSGEIRGQLTSDVPAYLYANLEGSQETPPVVTPASGEGYFTLSGDGKSLEYHVEATNLSAPITAAHFHRAPVGVAGPVKRPITFTADSSNGTWRYDDAQMLTPELVADLLGCYLYVNVHTSNYPGGEIRGQIYKTEEMPVKYMTIWAARNDANPDNFSRLSYYSLSEGQPFENDEGEITGYNGQKNIVDMTIDIGGNLYFLNNTWTSMIYRIRPSQIDLDPSTAIHAKQMGRTRTYPDNQYVTITNIQFIKGKLYGFDNKTNKLYDVNPYNAYVTELAVLDNVDSKAAGLAPGADGSVYLLKNTGAKRSELWKFNNFPSADLTLVTTINSPDKFTSFSAHPNGNLYATDSKNLYEINLKKQTVGVLKDHHVNIAAMEFDFFSEKNTAASGTVSFTSLDGVTGVDGFTGLPAKYELSQNFPNPFNPSTMIKFALPEAAFVKLAVYNALGEVVKTLVNESRNAGEYEINFNAAGLPSGVYFARIEAGSFVSLTKMVLLK
jgi:hypothetical protein